MNPLHARFGMPGADRTAAQQRRKTPGALRAGAVAAATAALLLGSTTLTADATEQDATPTSSAPGSANAAEACTVSAKLVPSCGAWWGVSPGGGGDAGKGVRAFEAKTNARTDFFHGYHRAGQMFPTRDEIAISRDSGGKRLLYLSLYPLVNGKTWAQVANGAEDPYLTKLAQHIKANYNEKFLMSIHHEPENDVRPTAGSGMTATDFKNMYRHVVTRLKAAGASNVVFVVNFQGTQKFHTESWWPAMYPGDDVVDWLGWDSYSCVKPGNDACNDFSEMVNRRFSESTPWPGFYNWARANHPDKPFILGEMGVYDTGDSRKADFFRTAIAQAPRFPGIKAIAYWDSGTLRKSFLSPGSDAAAAAGAFARSALFSQMRP